MDSAPQAADAEGSSSPPAPPRLRSFVARYRVALIIAAVVAFFASILLYLVPQARLPALLFAVAASLLAVRFVFFRVPGVSGMPFSHTRKLLSMRGPPAMKPKRA